MKRETREVKSMRTVYVALDGEEFSSEEECKKYEETAKGVINGKFCKTFNYNLAKGSGINAEDLYLFTESCEDEVVTFTPKTQDELDTLNMFMFQRGTSEVLGSEYVGKHLVFIGYDGEYYFQGDEETLRAKYEWNIQRILNNDLPRCTGCKFCNSECHCTNAKAYYSKLNYKGEVYTLDDSYRACYLFEEKENDRD